jgi:hypothetical protein
MDCYRLTIPIPKQPWRLFRFRILTILLLITITALLLSWRRDRQYLSRLIYQMNYPSPNWDVSQATGPPNTTGPGDIVTAWASATQDGQEEWLMLEYTSSVVPKAIRIHETFNPGAVFKITHVPRWGKEQILWEGTDPTPVGAGAGVSRIPLTTSMRTGRIKLYIDSQAVAGWNEIDAVGLEFGDGEVIWAYSATASTSYATGDQPTSGVFGMGLAQ